MASSKVVQYPNSSEHAKSKYQINDTNKNDSHDVIENENVPNFCNIW